MLKLKFKNKKGFTLLESLISIFVLTLAITGPIYISSFSLKNTISSRDNIAAQYLAEEIIEVVKNKRDGNLLNDTNWLSGITGEASCFRNVGDNSFSNVKCVMNKSNDGYNFTACNGNCDQMGLSTSSDVVYGFDQATDQSKFTREFYLEKGDLDQYDSQNPNAPVKELKITVNIKWLERGQQKVYTLTERLYNINYVDYFLN